MTEKNIIHFESGVLSFLCDNFHSVNFMYPQAAPMYNG